MIKINLYFIYSFSFFAIPSKGTYYCNAGLNNCQQILFRKSVFIRFFEIIVYSRC